MKNISKSKPKQEKFVILDIECDEEFSFVGELFKLGAAFPKMKLATYEDGSDYVVVAVGKDREECKQNIIKGLIDSDLRDEEVSKEMEDGIEKIMVMQS